MGDLGNLTVAALAADWSLGCLDWGTTIIPGKGNWFLFTNGHLALLYAHMEVLVNFFGFFENFGSNF